MIDFDGILLQQVLVTVLYWISCGEVKPHENDVTRPCTHVGVWIKDLYLVVGHKLSRTDTISTDRT